MGKRSVVIFCLICIHIQKASANFHFLNPQTKIAQSSNRICNQNRNVAERLPERNYPRSRTHSKRRKNRLPPLCPQTNLASFQALVKLCHQKQLAVRQTLIAPILSQIWATNG